jgi:hypothetical protein
MRLHPLRDDLSVDAPGRQPLCRHPQFSVSSLRSKPQRGLPLSVASDQFSTIRSPCPAPGLGIWPWPPGGPRSIPLARRAEPWSSPTSRFPKMNFDELFHPVNRASVRPAPLGEPSLRAFNSVWSPSLRCCRSVRQAGPPGNPAPLGSPSLADPAAGPVPSPPKPVARPLRIPRGLWIPGEPAIQVRCCPRWPVGLQVRCSGPFIDRWIPFRCPKFYSRPKRPATRNGNFFSSTFYPHGCPPFLGLRRVYSPWVWMKFVENSVTGEGLRRRSARWTRASRCTPADRRHCPYPPCGRVASRHDHRLVAT